MDTSELQKLAEHTRSMREAGVALILASGLLALFLLFPSVQRGQTSGEGSGSPTSQDSLVSVVQDAFAEVQIKAEAAIVYDLATGKTLYEKNAQAQLPLASLTKLLTVYAALTELSPDTPIDIPSEATRLEGPHLFSAGQTLALDDLARLTLTASLNDGAAAIASATANRQNLSQSDMLAAAAASLNLSQTYALNGSGLDVNKAVSGGYGSARDLALLSGALVERAPAIAYATTRDSAEAVSVSGKRFTVMNTDPVVGTIPRLLLSKTGYTDLAGGNLALVFDAAIGHPIAVIVLGSSQKARFTDGTALVNATFAHFAGVPSF